MDFYDIHTHQQQQQTTGVFAIANKYPKDTDFNRPFSIGIHPWYIKKEQIEHDFEKVESKLQHPNCYAVGECGLDTLADTSLELQIVIFKKQIALSETYQKPLIIHCVRAFNEIIQLKKELKPNQKWIVHGFDKNKVVAQSLQKNGICLSFGAKLITSKKIQDVLVDVALSQLFLETDTSSKDIATIYKTAATVKNMSLTELQKIITNNFTNTFLR